MRERWKRLRNPKVSAYYDTLLIERLKDDHQLLKAVASRTQDRVMMTPNIEVDQVGLVALVFAALVDELT